MRRYGHKRASLSALLLVCAVLALLIYQLVKPEKPASNALSERSVIITEAEPNTGERIEEVSDVGTESGLGSVGTLSVLAILGGLALIGGAVLFFALRGQKRRERYSHARSSHGEGESAIRRRGGGLWLSLPRKLRLKLRKRRKRRG